MKQVKLDFICLLWVNLVDTEVAYIWLRLNNRLSDRSIRLVWIRLKPVDLAPSDRMQDQSINTAAIEVKVFPQLLSHGCLRLRRLKRVRYVILTLASHVLLEVAHRLHLIGLEHDLDEKVGKSAHFEERLYVLLCIKTLT